MIHPLQRIGMIFLLAFSGSGEASVSSKEDQPVHEFRRWVGVGGDASVGFDATSGTYPSQPFTPNLNATLLWTTYGLSAQLGFAAQESASGSYRIKSEIFDLGLWGRRSILKLPKWEVWAGLGLIMRTERIETSLAASAEVNWTHPRGIPAIDMMGFGSLSERFGWGMRTGFVLSDLSEERLLSIGLFLFVKI